MFMYAYLRFAVGINASLSGQFLSSQCCEPFVYLHAVICEYEIWHYAIFFMTGMHTVRFGRGEFNWCMRVPV